MRLLQLRIALFFNRRRDKSVQLPRAAGKSVDAEALGSLGDRCCLAVNEVLKGGIQKARSSL